MVSAVGRPDDLRGLAVAVDGGDHRTAGGHDPVETARNDVPREPGCQPDHVHVGARQRLGQPLARLVRQEAYVVESEARGQPHHLSSSRTQPHDQDDEVFEIAQAVGGADERVEILRVADVSRMHDDELAGEAVLRRPRVVVRLRANLRDVDPVRDHPDPLRRSAFRLEARPHRLADGDDAVRAPQVERHRAAKRRDHERVSQPPERGRNLREHVLADDDERRSMPPRDEDRHRAEHRRIGHAQDDVRVPCGEAADECGAHERQVVQRPARKASAIERGGRHPLDRDAVPDDAPALALLVLHRARDHAHVVVLAKGLAQLGQQVRRRLRAGPVVLVEDQEPRRARAVSVLATAPG